MKNKFQVYFQQRQTVRRVRPVGPVRPVGRPIGVYNPRAATKGSNRCEVAKLSFCSEDVKTAALPPCEVAPDGGGCV